MMMTKRRKTRTKRRVELTLEGMTRAKWQSSALMDYDVRDDVERTQSKGSGRLCQRYDCSDLITCRAIANDGEAAIR